MKRQESIEEMLRSKLEGFEAEPPAFVFDQIQEALGNQSTVRVLPWWKSVASQRVAAAAAILLVSGTVYWVTFVGQTVPGAQMAALSNDSIRQLQMEVELSELEQAGRAVAATESNKLKENSPVMQPAVMSPRLENKPVETLAFTNESRNEMTIDMLPVKNIKNLKSQPAESTLLAASGDFGFIHIGSDKPAEQLASGSAIANTFTKLSSGQYFELAKQKVNEFVTKEHYVNFAIGDVEFGQTIQLSK